jgi:hypothetical protein
VHFSLAPVAAIDADSGVAPLGKYFHGCYFHSLSALTRWALGAAGLKQAFKHLISHHGGHVADAQSSRSPIVPPIGNIRIAIRVLLLV